MSRRFCPEHPVSGTFVLDLGHDEPVCASCLRGLPRDGAPIEDSNEETSQEATTPPTLRSPAPRMYPAPGGPTHEI